MAEQELTEAERHIVKTMGDLDLALGCGIQAVAISEINSLGKAFEGDLSLLDFADHRGLIRLIHKVMTGGRDGITRAAVSMLANSVISMTNFEGRSPSQTRILELTESCFTFFRERVLIVHERIPFSEPVFQAMVSATRSNESFRLVVLNALPMSWLKIFDVSSHTTGSLEQLTRAVVNLIEKSPEHVDIKEALGVFANICQGPNINCATVAKICLHTYGLVNTAEKARRLKVLSTAYPSLLDGVVNHISNQQTQCNRSCLADCVTLLAEMISEDNEINFAFVCQGLLRVLEVALSEQGLDSVYPIACLVVSRCMLAGASLVDSLLNHHIFNYLVDLVHYNRCEIRHQAYEVLDNFLTLAKDHHIHRAIQDKIFDRFVWLLTLPGMTGKAKALSLLEKILRLPVSMERKAHIKDEMRDVHIHLAVGTLLNAPDEDVKKAAIAVNKRLGGK